MKKQDFAELLAEAIAMFIIISFGDSVAGMYTLYSPSPYQNAYWGVCIAWGLAVTMAIYATGSISGTACQPCGHIGARAVPKIPLAQSHPLLRSPGNGRTVGGSPSLFSVRPSH
jgi:glycerol uptake facilitator-like aquaporin